MLKIIKIAARSTYKKEFWKIFASLLGVVLAVTVYVAIRIGADVAKNQATTDTGLKTFHVYGPELEKLYVDLLNNSTLRIVPWATSGDKIGVDILSLFYFCDIQLEQQEIIDLVSKGNTSCELNSLSPIRKPEPKIVDISNLNFDELYSLTLVGSDKEMKDVINSLPNYYQLQEVGSNTATARATEAFRLNLQVLAGLAFVVAGLLVYNTLTYIGLIRRKEYSTLIALGASPKKVKRSILFEAALFGVFGALSGTFLGVLISGFFSDSINSVAANLYRLAGESTIKTNYPQLFAEALFLSVSTCVLAAMVPARTISSEPPGAGFSYVRVEKQRALPLGKLLFSGLVFLVLGVICTSSAFLSLGTLAGFFSPLLVLAAGACLAPLFLNFIARACLNANVSLRTAANQILMTPGRSAISAASLALALGLSLSMAFLITSFRSSVENWVYEIAKADLFISRTERSNKPIVSESTLQKLESSGAVNDFDGQSTRIIYFRNGRTLVSSSDFDLAVRFERQTVLNGSFKTFDPLKDVLVSEAFTNKFGLEAGDSITLSGKDFNILAEVQDYTSDEGVIFVDNQLYQILYPGSVYDSLSIYTGGKDASALFAEEDVLVQTKEELASAVLKIFDQTFSTTHGMQITAFFVAVLSLITSLTMIFIERKHELSSLYAIGASKHTIRNIVIQESLILAGSGLIAGLVLGFGLGLVMIYSVNRHFFGWSVSFSFPFTSIATSSVVTLILAVLCGYVIARSVKLQAVRYS